MISSSSSVKDSAAGAGWAPVVVDTWRGSGHDEPAMAVLTSVDDWVERRTIVVCRLLDLVLGILKMWQVEMIEEKDSGLSVIAVLLARDKTEATHAHYSSTKLPPTMRSGPLSVRANCI